MTVIKNKGFSLIKKIKTVFQPLRTLFNPDLKRTILGLSVFIVLLHQIQSEKEILL